MAQGLVGSWPSVVHGSTGLFQSCPLREIFSANNLGKGTVLAGRKTLISVSPHCCGLLSEFFLHRTAEMACVVLPQEKSFEFEQGAFKTDDDLGVERLVASCQHRVMPVLTGAGRALVPYFSSSDHCVDESLSESRREVARNRKKANKKNAATAEGMHLGAGSPPKQFNRAAAAKQQGALLGRPAVHPTSQNTVKMQHLNSKKSSVASPNDAKAWAGPSYYTSPPPEDLPMPTPFLLSV